MLLINENIKKCLSYRYRDKEEMEEHIKEKKKSKYEIDFMSIKKLMAVFSKKIMEES